MMMQSTGQQAMANIAYQNQANAPKEIGYIQRLEGVRNGLDEINSRLFALVNRIAGGPPNGGDAAQAGPPCGVAGHLSTCEDHIRKALSVIAGLEQSF